MLDKIVMEWLLPGFVFLFLAVTVRNILVANRKERIASGEAMNNAADKPFGDAQDRQAREIVTVHNQVQKPTSLVHAIAAALREAERKNEGLRSLLAKNDWAVTCEGLRADNQVLKNQIAQLKARLDDQADTIRRLQNSFNELDEKYTTARYLNERLITERNEARQQVEQAAERQRAKDAEMVELEPEYPGDMPEKMFLSIKNDPAVLAETMRISVRLTKENIKRRILAQDVKSKGEQDE